MRTQSPPRWVLWIAALMLRDPLNAPRREKHPSWGLKKLLDVMGRGEPARDLPAISTAAKILAAAGLVKPKRRYRLVVYTCTCSAFIYQLAGASEEPWYAQTPPAHSV